MEEKNFLWFCKLLVSGKVRLNLLETIFLTGEAVESWIYTDDTGTIRRRSPGEEGLYRYTDVLNFFLSRLQSTTTRLTPSTVACSSLWKGVRTIMDVTQTEEALGKKDAFTRCSSLQEHRLSQSSRVSSYLYFAKYVHTQGYSTSVLRCIDNHHEKETSLRLHHKMRDMVQIVMNAIERVKLKRVMELELEFMQDEAGSLWIMACRRCRVAVPALCRPKQTLLPKEGSEPASKRIKDQLLKKKTKTYEKDDDSVRAALQQHKYVFKRGQLRNQHSNLNSPIRIHSPLSSQTGSQSESLTEPQSPRSPYSPRSIKTDRLNTNFQELLLLTYNKRKGIHTHNFEDFQRYIESVLQPNLETAKPRLSAWKPDLVFRTRPSFSISSDSGNSSQLSPGMKLELPAVRKPSQLMKKLRRSVKPAVRSQLPSPASRKPKLFPKNRTLEDWEMQLERLQPLLTPVLRSKRGAKIA